MRDAASEREVVVLVRIRRGYPWTVVTRTEDEEAALAAGWDVRHAILLEGDRVYA